MSFVRFPRCAPQLVELENRCTPAIVVDTTVWNPLLPGSLPNAIEEANATAGQDEIQFDWTELGNTPNFVVPADESLEVTEGVIIQAGGGNTYAKFTGFRPFLFTHMLPAPAPIGQLPAVDSVINGGYFDGCNVAGDDGGAIKLTAGTLTLNYNRFIGNQAGSGGAVFVGAEGTLFVGAAQGQPPAPTAFAEVLGSSAVFFKSNLAGADGGAIRTIGGHVKLYRAAFYNNEADLVGGAVAVTLGGTIFAGAVPNSEDAPEVKFVQNEADEGGVIHLLGGTSSLTSASFTANKALSGDGGAIYVSSDLTITNGNFFSNTATGDGGAIRVVAGTTDISGGTIQENTAGGDGGGIAVSGALGVVNASGVAFIRNTATGNGDQYRANLGGMFNNDGTCTFTT